MLEFKVNNYITLKLQGRSTNIYFKGKLFKQCKYLLLHIPVEEISTFGEIQSIDKAAEKLDRSLENRNRRTNIPPEVEFWGHCSNLQVWVENNYDTRLLQRTLAFPLLKKLSDIGDPIAQKVFKEQIVKRFESGTQNVKIFLINGGYLEYLGIPEIDFIFDNEDLKKVLIDKVLNLYNLEYHIITLLKRLVEKGSMKALEFLKEIILNKSSDLEFFVFFKKKNLLNYLNKQEYDLITSNELLLKSFNVIVELEKLAKKSLFCSSIEKFMGFIDKVGFTPSHRYCIKDNHIIGLILDQVHLSSFPESITNLENLQYLILTRNKIKEIPVNISNLEGLKLLKLEYNQIRMIPISIGFLPNLEELNLASNNLNSIPHTTGNLTNLKKLDLSSNNILLLPKSIGELSLLEELNVEENKLRNIPPSIGRLTLLKHLNLEKNAITELPESIGDLGSLESLRLSRNKIEKIPVSLRTLPNLKDISFFNNPVKNVPNSIKNFRILVTEELKFLEDLRKYDEYSVPDMEEYFIKDAIDVSECKKHYYGELSYRSLFENWIIDGDKFFFFYKKHIIGIALLANCVPNSIKNLTKLKFFEIINLEGASNNSKINIHEILNKISHNSKLRYLRLKGSGLEIDPDLTKITHNSNLRYLYWLDSLLETIPNLTKIFPKLIGFYLGRRFKSTPKWLFEFAQKHNTRWYTRRGVVKGDAEVLGLLSIVYGDLACDGTRDMGGYSIDESGHVVELKIGYWYWHHNQNEVISYFPEEISRLQYLERLYVNVGAYDECWKEFFPFKEGESDVWIPESISKLKSLRYLCTNAKYSETLLSYLNSLEKFQQDTYEGDKPPVFFTREARDYPC